MRAILIIILILVIALLITPYWFGIKAEKEYSNIVETVSKFENMEIVSNDFKRGWFTSTGEITFIVNKEGEEPFQIVENDTIYHGPIPVGLIGKGKFSLKPVLAVIETKAELSANKEIEYSDLIDSMPEMNFETTLELNGNGSTAVSVPMVEKKLQDGKNLKWSGLEGLINFTPDLTEVTSVINSPNFVIEDDSFILGISGLNIDSNLNYPASNFKNPLGNVEVLVDEFSSEGKDGDELNKLTLSNLKITASTNQRESVLNHIHSLVFDTLSVGGNSYGPGEYELELRNINKKAFQQIQEILSKNQNSMDSTSTNEILTSELMKVLPELIVDSPEIELTKLNLKTGQGDLSGHAIISLKGEPELAQNPILLLAALSAEIDISVSKDLFENVLRDYKIEEITDELNSQNKDLPDSEELKNMANAKAQAELKQWLDYNIFVLKNDNYVIELSYSLGQIKLNGNPLDINSLLNLGG